MSVRQKSQTWQKSLAQSREMRGTSGGLLYERMVLLNNVFLDGDWRLRQGQLDESELMALLDGEVADVFLPFGELREMLLFAPERAQWTDGNLVKLRAAMHQSRADARKAQQGERPTPRRVTKEELKAVEDEKAKVEMRASYLEGEAKSWAEKCRELEEENRQLQRELARAEGRISELERIVNGELVAA